MNESGRSTSGGRGTARLMGVMTVAEVALALMLVVGAGWLVQSFSRLRATDPGFVAPGRLIVDVRPDPQSVRGGDQTIAWTRSLFDRLRPLGGLALQQHHDGAVELSPQWERGGRSYIRHTRLPVGG